MPQPMPLAERAQGWDEQAAVLSRLAAPGSAEDVAGQICREMVGLDGIDLVMVVAVDASDRVVTLAGSGTSEATVGVNQPLPDRLASLLRTRIGAGPWVGPWDLTLGPIPGRRGIAPEPSALAVIAIGGGPRPVGGLIVGTARAGGIRSLAARLPALESFAALAGSLLSADLIGRQERAALEGQLTTVLAERAFAPVFQPIIALDTGLTVGYEALTRFDDGVRPDRRFADAAAVGRGPELELACLTAAIEAADALPAGPWLSLNVSPELVRGVGRLRRTLARAPRRVVLEVTSHAAIDDQRAFRKAFAGLGRGHRLAVDDAGGGAASLRQIVGLRPDFVKIDMGLVHAIERDQARQALVAGLVYLAGRNRFTLIAEGIETDAEHEMLRALDVGLGQGFLLGRPARVDRLAPPEIAADTGAFAGLS
jgi:EAL domain-containing protein (putative c-di-GMP-specific phosphodiesterase class I)